MARQSNKRKALLDAFGDRYKIFEHDGGLILYDTEAKSKRANALFKGKFYLSTNNDKYSFQERYYDSVETLIEAMDEWVRNLPFDAEIYNPMYKCSYHIECALHDYLKSLGFKIEWESGANRYFLKDNYGKDICSLLIDVKDNTTEGTIKQFVAEGRWIESSFVDLDSAISSCNSIIVSYCGVMNAQLTNVLKTLTNSRSAILLDKTFDINRLAVYTKNATDNTIKWLEKELKRLKDK